MINHDDLTTRANDEFDRIVRDPDEFRKWVRAVLSRCAVSPTLMQEAGEAIAAALFTFVTNVLEAEDEDMVALDRMLDNAVSELASSGLTTRMLQRRDGHGYDVRCFWDYAAQRAVEDAAEVAPEGPEHQATGVTV